MACIHRSAQSELDYLEIWFHIAQDNVPAADNLIERFD